jgi:hypothetical protein
MKFFKQMMLLTVCVILLGSLASRADARSHPAKNAPVVASNCSPSSTGPLEASSSYAFQALGADSTSTVPGSVATTTLVGSFVTDSKGCPTNGFLAVNDNGFSCTGTFTSTLVEGTPTNTGTMTWTSASCFVDPLVFLYSSASNFSDVMYFASNGTDVFTFAGKVQENQPTN